MYKTIVFLLIVFSLGVTAQVKTIGTPHIDNYTKSDYKAGTQNWGISQSKNGFMYFANNEGVLQFDGLHWDLIEVSKSSPVRSVFTDSLNHIYVGLFNDLGQLVPDQNGRLYYKSLRHLLPAGINFDDIWQIYESPLGIVFQSFNYIFILKNNQLQIIEPTTRFLFSYYVNKQMLVQEPEIGLFEYKNGSLAKVPWAGELSGKSLWSILEYGEDGLLLSTSRAGIYKYENDSLVKWNTPVSRMVERAKLFSASRVDGNYYAFGTIQDGVFISDYEGNIVQHINRNQGLQNNTVLSLFTDSSENLWLGLDYGIDFIEINSPISYISQHEGLGTGYTARIFDNKLYMGTNQGLFVKSFNDFSGNNEKFELVENTTGQVWSLNIFDNQLICSHNLGTFVINDKKAELISDEEGAWKYIRLNNYPELLLGGHYNGLVLLKKENNKWKFYKKVKGFHESSRYLQQDSDGFLWMSHMSKGIFRISLTEEMDSVAYFQLYTNRDGLPSNDENIIFLFRNKIYASTKNGFYKFHKETDSFIISEELNELFKLESQLKTIEIDEEGNIWFIAENESGVLRINEDLTYTKITSPFKQIDDYYVNNFEFIYPYNNNHVFLGIDNGFAHYSNEFPKSYMQPFQSFITKVEMPYIDSTLYLLGNKKKVWYKFPFNKNAFRFQYTAPFYEDQNNLQFSYILVNYDETWSEWSENSFKDFTNLPEGKYVFKLKARNIYGVESSVSSFGFRIMPPWYRSSAAYYIYLVLVVMIIFLATRFLLYRIGEIKKKAKRKHRTELKQKEKEFQHQALIAEKEIIRLKNEKLQNEMVHRDMELANQTMGIIQKNKFLVKVKDELQRMQKSTDDEKLKKKLTSLNRNINKEIDNKQQNQIFETYFDEVHSEFFERLKEKYPDISPREMRLCAFIRMNLTSKEIAMLLNISDRGVEISRYRLRKKLDISRETNLSVFLSNI